MIGDKHDDEPKDMICAGLAADGGDPDECILACGWPMREHAGGHDVELKGAASIDVIAT